MYINVFLKSLTDKNGMRKKSSRNKSREKGNIYHFEYEIMRFLFIIREVDDKRECFEC